MTNVDPDTSDPALHPEHELVLLGIVGSQAYGLAHPDSDIDRLGIFQVPTISLLGLQGTELADNTRTSTNPDVTLHELGKFVRLASKANPTVTELLWLTGYETCTDAGQQLIAARTAFLSTGTVLSAYVGYAASQAEKVLRRSDRHGDSGTQRNDQRITKHARHTFRLLLGARQLLTTGELTLDVSHESELIFERGDQAIIDPAAFHQHFEQEVAELKRLPSVLPERVDLVRIDQLLKTLRVGSGIQLR